MNIMCLDFIHLYGFPQFSLGPTNLLRTSCPIIITTTIIINIIIVIIIISLSPRSPNHVCMSEGVAECRASHWGKANLQAAPQRKVAFPLSAVINCQ